MLVRFYLEIAFFWANKQNIILFGCKKRGAKVGKIFELGRWSWKADFHPGIVAFHTKEAAPSRGGAGGWLLTGMDLGHKRSDLPFFVRLIHLCQQPATLSTAFEAASLSSLWAYWPGE